MRDGFDVRTLDAYRWANDLVAVDERLREAALARQHGLLRRWRPERPTGTLVDPVAAFTGWPAAPSDAVRRRVEPYAVLFLRWEARFPAQWRTGWLGSPWSAKEAVLGTFVRHGATPETRVALRDLLIGAVHRVQRCQDRWYWRLARHLDDPPLRVRLGQATEHPTSGYDCGPGTSGG